MLEWIDCERRSVSNWTLIGRRVAVGGLPDRCCIIDQCGNDRLLRAVFAARAVCSIHCWSGAGVNGGSCARGRSFFCSPNRSYVWHPIGSMEPARRAALEDEHYCHWGARRSILERPQRIQPVRDRIRHLSRSSSHPCELFRRRTVGRLFFHVVENCMVTLTNCLMSCTQLSPINSG